MLKDRIKAYAESEHGSKVINRKYGMLYKGKDKAPVWSNPQLAIALVKAATN